MQESGTGIEIAFNAPMEASSAHITRQAISSLKASSHKVFDLFAEGDGNFSENLQAIRQEYREKTQEIAQQRCKEKPKQVAQEQVMTARSQKTATLPSMERGATEDVGQEAVTLEKELHQAQKNAFALQRLQGIGPKMPQAVTVPPPMMMSAALGAAIPLPPPPMGVMQQVTHSQVQSVGKAEAGSKVQKPEFAQKTRAQLLEHQERIEHLRKQVIDQLKAKIRTVLSEGKSAVELKLKPEILGNVKTLLSINDNELQAQFFVDNESVQELVKESLEDLRAQLKESGYLVGQIDVNVDDKQHSQKNFSFSKRKSGPEESVEPLFLVNNESTEEGVDILA